MATPANEGGIHLFPPTIWKYTYNFPLNELETPIQEVFESVERNSSLEKGAALSTVTLPEHAQPHTWEELADFQQWLGNKLTDIKEEFNFYERQSTVIGSWFNRHYKTGYTEEHCHNFSTFVASCYLKCPPNSGNIVFRNPLEYHYTNFPIVNETQTLQEVQCNTGDVIIFPSWLKHFVRENKTDQERIVMTINIK
jgi:uncharacterized protein (TIGR02466 family)|tara:strand:+ start:3873 stop:4460 length:588 start_codon:yes stop_codon:yes gene_type:complete